MSESGAVSRSTDETASSLDTGSRVLLSMFVLGPLAVLFVFLFFLGPLGWIAIATLVLAGMIFQAGRTYDVDSTHRSDVRNCGACGAPNDADDEQCSHCGETFPGQNG